MRVVHKADLDQYSVALQYQTGFRAIKKSSYLCLGAVKVHPR
jgi:hypothetical protein